MKPLYYRPRGNFLHRSCRMKRRFETREEALRANGGHRPYRCAFCQGWHLASK